MIDVHRLRILREVSEQGSFAKAAASLLLTPSAVSQQVAALEKSLGRPVVERSTRGVTLTESGRVLVEAAETVAAELAAAQERIDRLADGHTGRLAVATFTSAGQSLLPPALIALNAHYRDVELTVSEAEPADAAALVREGRADLALAYHFGRTPEVPGLVWTPLMDEQMWLVMPRSHRLARRRSLPIAELTDERWIEGCGAAGAPLARASGMAGFQPDVVCTSTDYLFSQSLVEAGVGIALIPRIALATHKADSLAFIPLEHPRPVRHIGALTARRRWAQPLVDTLLTTLKDAVGTITPDPRDA
ncbi:LysR family transcriptional regulator [Yinghuangia seranimata]|uniref:LysR family transcriptional regulator n=1 Tax=Yinghuangia seranimata TaxID=408067 RepID=UPI00248CB168|nr:LysR family transcriptional regulator [Yinghuangia seranimata]MDI2124854.1 LysR family transcriptional regulator [Yinghuangia seranimata]